MKSSFVSGNDMPSDSETNSHMDSDNASSFFDPPIENYSAQYQFDLVGPGSSGKKEN